MNTRKVIGLLIMTLMGTGTQAIADVSVRFTTGHGQGAWRDSDRRRYGPYPLAYNPWHSPRRIYWARPYRAVTVTPVVVTQPIYVPAPHAQIPPPAYAPSLTGDYGRDLAALHEKLSRLRGVVQRQKQTGQITQVEYDRFTSALEGIEHDQHARAFDNGGNLEPQDFADLFRRLDQTGEDIEIALAN